MRIKRSMRGGIGYGVFRLSSVYRDMRTAKRGVVGVPDVPNIAALRLALVTARLKAKKPA